MKRAANLFCFGIFTAIMSQMLMAMSYNYLIFTLPESAEALGTFAVKYLLAFIAASFCITIIIVPVMSKLMKNYARRYRQQNEECEPTIEKQGEKLRKCLIILAFAWLLCWLAFGVMMGTVVEDRLGLRHGSDDYMLLGGPGAILSFLPGISAIVADRISFGWKKETPWHKRKL